MIGGVGSAVFSLALGLEGRRRSFAEMSMARFGLWGGLAGLTVGMVLYSPLVLAPNGLFTVAEAVARMSLAVGVTTAIGALSATGSLGLTDREARELLD